MIEVRTRSMVVAHLERICGGLTYREGQTAGAAVLVYHGIVEAPLRDVLSEYTVELKAFREHIRWWKRHAEVVSMNTLVECLQEGREPDRRWLVLSLDDALKNQVTLAAGVLDEHKLPWTLAVPAGLVGTGRTVWSYELRFLIHRCWSESLIPLPPPSTSLVAITTSTERRNAERQIRRILFDECSATVRQSYLQQLIDRVGRERFREQLASDARFELANWDDLRRLRSNVVTLCSHGWTHSPQTPRLPMDELNIEFVDSRRTMEAELGHPPSGFALPHGIAHRESAQLANLAGYEWCLSTVPGRVHADQPLMSIPRFAAEYPLTILRRSLTKNWSCL